MDYKNLSSIQLKKDASIFWKKDYISKKITRTVNKTQVGTFVPGRRGLKSIADTMIQVLSSSKTKGRAMTISEITKECAKESEQDVSASTIRSTLYRHKELFKRISSKSSKPCFYTLTQKVQ